MNLVARAATGALLTLTLMGCDEKTEQPKPPVALETPKETPKYTFLPNQQEIDQTQFPQLQREYLRTQIKEVDGLVEEDKQYTEKGIGKTYARCIISIHNKEYGFQYSSLDVPKLYEMSVSCKDAIYFSNLVRGEDGKPYFLGGTHIVEYLTTLKEKEGNLNIEKAKKLARKVALLNKNGSHNVFTQNSFTLKDIVNSGKYEELLK